MKRVVFWQNALSIHQAPFLREFSDIDEVSVHVVAFGRISNHRQTMGWGMPDYGKASVEVVEPDDWPHALATNADADVHVFSGFGTYRGLKEVQASLVKNSNASLLVITEPWDDRGPTGWLRLQRARRRVNRVGPKLAAVFTCGNRARRQLQSMRVLRSVPIYDFGYFVDSSEFSPRPVHVRPRLTFVGQMVERKAPLELIHALAKLRNLDWELRMFGDGDLKAAVETAISDHELADRVKLLGYQPYQEVRAAIASSDLVVLPSSHDGWGAVVNEALMDGTQVLVSDMAGASDLITSDLMGRRFVSGDQNSFEGSLRDVLLASRTDEARSARRKWASDSISPSAVARYFNAVLVSMPEQVNPPWLPASGQSS